VTKPDADMKFMQYILTTVFSLIALGSSVAQAQPAEQKVYSASIKSGQVSSRNSMRVEGMYRDVFDTKDWGLDFGHIWRVYIAAPTKFIWSDGSRYSKVELAITEMSLSGNGKDSSLHISVNGKRGMDFGKAPFRRKVVDITSFVVPGENVLEVSSTEGTDLLHGVQSVEVTYYASSDVTAPQITILEPAVQRGLRIVRKDKAITVRGRVTDENGIYEVSVNDAEASVAANGDFQAQVLLAVGENQIRVRATDAKKNTSETAFTITRESDSMKGVIQPADHEPAFISGRYYALIIAVQNYHDPSVNGLDHPIQDASRLKAILTGNYSFEEGNIIFLRDPDRATIINKLDELTEKITENDCLLIFYAGHGYWDETLKQGFWLPSNAKRDTRSEWLPNSTLRDYLGGIKAKHTLLIADACFSGSIFKTRDAFSDAQASVKELYRLPSRKAMTSGAMKSVPDKSVFVEYLVKRLAENQQRYISAEELFSSMRKAIINNSPNKQTPQYGEIRETGDEGGDFVFVRR
jgi:caspase domain-containing protein/glucodextranase-like protein